MNIDCIQVENTSDYQSLDRSASIHLLWNWCRFRATLYRVVPSTTSVHQQLPVDVNKSLERVRGAKADCECRCVSIQTGGHRPTKRRVRATPRLHQEFLTGSLSTDLRYPTRCLRCRATPPAVQR